MRFMLFMIPNNESEAGAMPTPEQIDAMMAYNKALADAGVLLALDGLQPSSKGRASRSRAAGQSDQRPLQRGEGGHRRNWIVQVKSKEEAVEWASRCPADESNVIEVRQIFEMADFGPEAEQQEAGRTAEIGQSMEANKSQASA